MLDSDGLKITNKSVYRFIIYLVLSTAFTFVIMYSWRLTEIQGIGIAKALLVSAIIAIGPVFIFWVIKKTTE